MIVHKKYPKVEYTLHVELSQEEVRKLIDETAPLDRLARPTLFRLLDTIYQEAVLPPIARYGC